MMRTLSPVLMAVTAILCTLTALPAMAQKRMKLGTAAPTGSSFHRILEEMGTEWKQQGIDLKMYAGGIRGGEAQMVREMRGGALDLCLISAIGLSEIDPTVEALQSIPLLFRSLDEFDFVAMRLQPKLAQRLRAKGFVVLFWADAGWVRFFSTKPVTRPDDLRRLKLFTWAGDVLAVDLYTKNQFKPVVLETEDILPSLKTGMIEAVPMPPYMALMTQVYRDAPYMLDLNWAPLAGALVVTESSWNRLDAATQRELARAAGEAGTRMKATNRRESDAAVAAMTKRGLKTTSVPIAALSEWRATAERTYPALREKKITPELFDEITRLIVEYRHARP
ncbi:MAG: TRAP transporter substrate-binding protein DctP [Thermoanaerobaculia bacterium]|nr:TRAP transporter substrate-binding protein DctP [Thermoanaerobaculia bacterium]